MPQRLSNNDHWGSYISDYCPISGFPVYRKPEWCGIQCGPDFKITIEFIGPDIIHIISEGYITGPAAEKAIRHIDSAYKEFCPDNRKIVGIEDYTQLRGATIKARRMYINYWKEHPVISTAVLYGMNPIFRFSCRLISSLKLLNFKMIAVDDYNEGLELALDLLTNGQAGFIKKIKDNFSFHPSSSKLKVPQKGSKTGIDELVDFIDKLSLDPDIQLENELLEVSQDNPFRPVFDAIMFLKYDLDSVMRERNEKETALKNSEERYKLVVDNIREGIVITQRGTIKFLNSSIERFVRKNQKDIVSRNFVEWIHPEDRQWVADMHIQRMAGGEAETTYVFRALTPDGRVVWISNQTVMVEWDGEPAVLNFLNDITERKIAEEKIQAALKEKDVLLKEVHHRVKNNMQVISSLLNLQASRIKDEQALEAFKDSQNRIKAMATIHHILYDSENLASINLKNYLTTLTKDLKHSYSVLGRPVVLRVDSDEIFLTIDQIVPCGLVINEIITNSFKHGFPQEGPGEIWIIARNGHDGLLDIEIGDNGCGLPPDVSLNTSATLGMTLIKNLVERQLDGEITVNTEKGTLYRIRFKKTDTAADRLEGS